LILKTLPFGILLLLSHAVLAQSQDPVVAFSLPGGFYEEAVTVELFADPGARVYYTIDGNKPTARTALYKQPLTLTSNTVVRAVAVLPGGQTGQVTAQSYFIGEVKSGIPVVSIAAPPALLFDPDIGLFMAGNNVSSEGISKLGANFWSRRELVIHAEIFETDGRCVFNSPVGMRMFGGISRLFPQKSMALVARERYGDKRFYHPVFGKNEPKSFKFLVLRNSGSDFGRAHFRDALMTGLLDDWDIDKQASRPAHVYINGFYWGIYNIREKVNRYFLADHHGVHKDSLDLLEHRYNVRRGGKAHYVRLVRFVETRDLKNAANYAWVKTQMDVENFMNYQIAQIYFDNQDAGGNIKFWRPQTADGRWRWILYDTDWGFGLHDEKAYRNNSLAFHTEPEGPNWPNPPWSTLLLRKLLENPEFREAFLTRFNDRLNTTFLPDRVNAAIEEKHQELLPEMARHIARWRLSRQQWDRHVQIMHTFATERPQHVLRHLAARFKPGELRHLHVSASPGGTLRLNDVIEVTAAGGDFSGHYFETLPLNFKTHALPGYRFSHWEGWDADERSRELTLRLPADGLSIRAVFEPYLHPLAGKIIINEISPDHRRSGDWIELYNTTRQRVDVSGWVLADARHETVLPETSIGPRDYLILCRDEARFRQVFPGAYNVFGCLQFGLNKREERLFLFGPEGALVDEMHYRLPPTDSVFTLSLLLPHLDNNDPNNWEQTPGEGTPGAANPYYVQSSISNMQKEWLEIGIAAGVLLICILLLVLRRRGVF
jgi:hypothetical protein